MASKSTEVKHTIATGLVNYFFGDRTNSVVRIGDGKVIQLEGEELKTHIRSMARQMHKPVQEVGRRLVRNRWVILAKK